MHCRQLDSQEFRANHRESEFMRIQLRAAETVSGYRLSILCFSSSSFCPPNSADIGNLLFVAK